MTNTKTVKRVAEIGEKILITKPLFTFGEYKQGDILRVESHYSDNSVNAEDVGVCITHGEYEVIDEEENNALESLATLKQTEESLAELRRQAYAEGYEQGKIDARIGEIRETAQEKRDRIIERAEIAVEELVNHGKSSSLSHEGNSIHREHFYAVEFVVNKEKRTVVALVKDSYSNKLFERGIAKCAPDDCFNSTLGKAIALYRALGLEVLEDYIYAPQPTEVRIGDIVTGGLKNHSVYNERSQFKIIGRTDEGYEYADGGGDWIREDQIGRIIDDSREVDAQCQ